jgi:predicted metal-binding protein
LQSFYSTHENKKNKKIKELIEGVYKLGANNAAVISTKNIIVDQFLADRCREPKCIYYGLSKSCPPHVAGPSWFKKNLENYDHAVFFRIDIPSEILYSSQNREIFQLLHQVAAGIEKFAVKMGFADAQAYAGGSCKNAFCHEYPECQALSEKGECRHPEYARASMSGFGINVARLFETCGWTRGRGKDSLESTETKMESVCGLVLIE